MNQMSPVRVLGVVLCLALCAPAGADDRKVREAIDTAYRDFAQGFRSEDADLVAAFLTPDYTHTTKDGKVFKRERMTGSVKEFFSSMRWIDRARFDVTAIRVSGNSVTATVRFTLHAMTERDEKGFFQEIERKSRVAHTWTRTPSGWRIRQGKELESTVTAKLKAHRNPPERPKS